jgi:hypothetical protein
MKVANSRNGAYYLQLVLNSDYHEYQIKVYTRCGGKLLRTEILDYFTDDLEDAETTFEHMKETMI